MNKKKVEVLWHDAVKFKNIDELPIVLSNIMITKGYLIEENEHYILLKCRVYYYIPKCLVLKVKEIV
ncbi:MAG: hypothetical protein KatS3mg003_1053 [Candidatus Nitrosocaldaceae archaeon]|nr:MAG: hypothetical protein KatS3mg003_1053 [Candidatus Nitrosocaldaceae archaeon]